MSWMRDLGRSGVDFTSSLRAWLRVEDSIGSRWWTNEGWTNLLMIQNEILHLEPIWFIHPLGKESSDICGPVVRIRVSGDCWWHTWLLNCAMNLITAKGGSNFHLLDWISISLHCGPIHTTLEGNAPCFLLYTVGVWNYTPVIMLSFI